MNRRDFLQLTGLAGLTVLVPSVARHSWANGADVDNKRLWVFVHAGGGWDPTLLCDPKGGAASDPAAVNHYDPATIASFGNHKCAPLPKVQAFFQAHGDRLLVINGIDCQTNSHDTGTRFAWSGHLSEGWPSLAALIAAQTAPERALAFVSYGGYDYTGGVAPLTRLGSPDTFNRLARPDLFDPNKPERYHTATTSERIEAAARARLQAMQNRPMSPHAHANAAALYALRTGDNDLSKLIAALPAKLEADPLKQQAQLIVAGFQSGLAVSANMARGGFDTHGEHDANHIPAMENLIESVGFLWDTATAAGLADRLTVVVGSDFGRTPQYNAGKGKDHWSVTSVLLMGAGVTGNRVVGATTADFKALALNPQTLALDAGGTRLTHGSVHRSLRQLAGLEGTALAGRFPISEPLVAGLLG
jgi:uncharacterized protein (DUF1501 family)